MLGMIKRDLILMLSSKRERLFLLLYIPFLVVVVESNDPKWLYFVVLITYTYLISISSFTYDVIGKSIYMMTSLPITKKEVVIYKYLSLFVYFFLTIVYAGVYLWIINALKIKNVDYFNIEVIKKAIPTLLFSTSIVFPSYFKFEPKIAQITHIVVFMLIFIAIVNGGFVGENSIVARFGLFKDVNIYFSSIFIYLVSLLLSIKLYENRDL